MSDRPRRGVPRTALALLWFGAALVVGGLGALLFLLAEQDDDRLLGVVLLTAALLALGASAAVAVRGEGARGSSLALSAVFVVVGLGAALVPLTETTVFVEDVLLVGGPPVVAGLLTAAVALAGRRRA